MQITWRDRRQEREEVPGSLQQSVLMGTKSENSLITTIHEGSTSMTQTPPTRPHLQHRGSNFNMRLGGAKQTTYKPQHYHCNISNITRDSFTALKICFALPVHLLNPWQPLIFILSLQFCLSQNVMQLESSNFQIGFFSLVICIEV